MITRITITEQTTSGRRVTIPVTPEEIEFLTNGTKFASYNILDKGEVKIPNGTNLRRVKWTSILPGPGYQHPHGFASGRAAPEWFQTIFSEWKTYGTPLKLLITGTPINMSVYLNDYKVKYSGAFGNYNYSIEFIDRKELAITSTLIDRETSSVFSSPVETQTERPFEIPETYTAVKGDTWWSIAEKCLGEGSRYMEIYNANKNAKVYTKWVDGKRIGDFKEWGPMEGEVLTIPQPHVPVVEYRTTSDRTTPQTWVDEDGYFTQAYYDKKKYGLYLEVLDGWGE